MKNNAEVIARSPRRGELTKTFLLLDQFAHRFPLQGSATSRLPLVPHSWREEANLAQNHCASVARLSSLRTQLKVAGIPGSIALLSTQPPPAFIGVPAAAVASRASICASASFHAVGIGYMGAAICLVKSSI